MFQDVHVLFDWWCEYVLVVGSALYRCPGSRPEEQSVN